MGRIFVTLRIKRRGEVFAFLQVTLHTIDIEGRHVLHVTTWVGKEAGKRE